VSLARCCAGRADYFGNLPNLAARVSALAAPGQVLVEGTGLGLDDAAFTMREDSAVLLPPLEGEHRNICHPSCSFPCVCWLL
jgi:hypothetical protein